MFFAITTLTGCGTIPAVKEPADVSPNPLYTHAIKLSKEGNEEQAISRFSAFTQQFSTISSGHTNLGLLHLRRGELQLASQSFEQAIAIRADDKIAYNHLGVVRRQQGQFTAAQESYLEAIAIDVEYAEAHLNLGILYDLYLGQLAKALEHYQRYQYLTQDSDQEVAKWIIDLTQRLRQETGG
jgi:tetratricopeptide (TPR) repeat protein